MGTNLTGVVSDFLAAWQAHDVDQIMSFMAEDCVFHASTGELPHGTTHHGRAAVREAFAALLDRFPDASWSDLRHSAWQNRGLSEWVFSGTGPDGPVRVAGCDLLTFRDNLILVKDTICKRATW